MAKTKRKSTSKRLRFEVFKRDNFTCQYCGAQPPGVVLVCDHIDPVALGGKTTIDNLVTACEPCNQGKSDKPLGNIHPRPDADLLFMEVQQEIAELRKFQAAEKQRDELLNALADDLQNRWMDITGDDYPPKPSVFVQMLRKYSAWVVNEALVITAKKDAEGKFYKPDDAIPYMWGVARRISERLEEHCEGGES